MANQETRFRPGTGEIHEEPIEIDVKRARAGRTGLPVLYVLLWSMALAIVVLLTIWGIFHHLAH